MGSQQAIVQHVVSDLLTANYIAFALFAVVIYDWLIKLDEEVHCFWHIFKGRKVNAAGLLYGLSRYPVILNQVLYLLTAFPMSEKACQINHDLQIITSLTYVLIPPVFSAIRVHVLSSSNRTATILVFLLLFVPTFASLVMSATANKAVELPRPLECTLVPLVSVKPADSLSTACLICNIAGDLLVTFVTWRDMYSSYRMRRGHLNGSSLAIVMLHNGSIYFIIITGMNILNIVLKAILSVPTIANFAANTTPPLTTVLISHFLLDLQQAAGRSATAVQLSSPSLESSLDFATPTLRTCSESPTAGHCHGTLPAFIASMASDIHGPRTVTVYCAGREGSDMGQTDGLELEGGPGDSPDEIAMADLQRDEGV